MKKVRVCPECGVQKQVAKENRWQDNGSILTFEFELELGEEIMPVILEAQKDRAKSILQREELASEPDVRLFLAERGLGELAGYDLGERRLEAKVENAYPHLMVVGLLHGMFEILTGREGKSSYVMEEDESLTVTVEAA